MRKLTKTISVAMAALAMASCFASCGIDRNVQKNEIINDGKTINVLINETGYGTSYIYEMKENFERIYADEGYKVNVLAPIPAMSNTVMYSSVYMNEGIDVFFGTLDLQEGVNSKEYGQSFADITDLVFKAKPIKLDGTEEDCTVESKMKGNYNNVLDGKYYGLPYAFNNGGLGVNVKALESCGLSIPRTSDELFECVDTIMSKFGELGIYPIIYSGNTAYLQQFLHFWLGQYAGEENIQQFWSMQNKDGTNMQAPSDVFSPTFADGALVEAMEDFYRICDPSIAASGSQTGDFKSQQKGFMKGEAVFYPVGDWLYQEEKERSAALINDVVQIRVPLISALGTKLFGANTDYKYDDKKCEDILRAIVSGVDENKELATIVQEVNAACNVSLKEEDVAIVCERAGYVLGRSSGACAMISEKSTVKDIAALFLRMITSDDGASMFAHETFSSNPFNMDALSDVENPWIKSSAARINNRYMSELTSYPSGYRVTKGVTSFSLYTGDSTHTKIFEQSLTLYNINGVRKEDKYAPDFDSAAKNMVDAIYEDAVRKLG